MSDISQDTHMRLMADLEAKLTKRHEKELADMTKRATDAETALTKVRETTATKLAEVTKRATDAEAANAARERALTLADAGVTSEARRNAIVDAYTRSGAEESLSDWLAGAGAENEIVTAFLPSQATEGEETQEESQEQEQAKIRPRANNGARQTSGAPAKISPEALAKMSLEDKRKHLSAFIEEHQEDMIF